MTHAANYRAWLLLAAAGLATGCQTADQSAGNHGTKGYESNDRYDGGKASVFDPYSLGVTGDANFTATGAAPQPGMSLTPKTPPQIQPTNQYHDFIGQVLLGQGAGYEAIDPFRNTGSLSQISFSLEGADFDPDVSPNGDRIVFSSTQHGPTSDIYLKSTESRVITQLTNDPAQDVMPKFSPDGNRVAFASNRAGNWDIYVMPDSAGAAMQITTESSHELHPSWSPDGKNITFCRLSEITGKWEIWVTEVGNPGVAHYLTDGLFPEWCPVPATGENGADRIVFQRSRERGDRAFTCWTVDFKDGSVGNVREIVQSAYAACINPTWSRDGQWITFATVPNPTQWAAARDTRPNIAELWLVGADGTSLVPLTQGRAVNLMPTWGPNNRIYFVSDRSGVDNIWQMDANPAIYAATGVNPAAGATASVPANDGN